MAFDLIAYRHEYYLKNKEAILEKNKRWALENPERRRELQKRSDRKYYLNHVNDRRAYARSRDRSGQVNDTGKKYREMIRNLLIQRDGNVCQLCKEVMSDLTTAHIDHILPQNMGGSHEADNIRLVHASCNLTRPKWFESVESCYTT